MVIDLPLSGCHLPINFPMQPAATLNERPGERSIIERDPRTGHFLPGNKAAIWGGNPHAEKVVVLRQALVDAVSPDDIRAVVVAMVAEAKAGNVLAANLILDRTIGKVQPAAPEQMAGVAEQLTKLWREWRADAPEDAKFTVMDGPGGAEQGER